MITLKPYREGDEWRIKGYTGDGWNAIDPAIMTYQTRAWTVMIGEEPVAVMGMTMLWTGSWDCWFVGSGDLSRFALRIARVVREKLDEVARLPDVKRLSASARGDMPQHVKFLQVLGFELEALLEQAYDGHVDVLLFRRKAHDAESETGSG